MLLHIVWDIGLPHWGLVIVETVADEDICSRKPFIGISGDFICGE
jgi:hypothetical protein